VHDLLHGKKEKLMRKENNHKNEGQMLDEYDFSHGVRGKYADRYKEGSNVVVLEPDVVQVFQNSDAVNRALRALADIIRSQSGQTPSKHAKT
jgi:hypothetical protein